MGAGACRRLVDALLAAAQAPGVAAGRLRAQHNPGLHRPGRVPGPVRGHRDTRRTLPRPPAAGPFGRPPHGVLRVAALPGQVLPARPWRPAVLGGGRPGGVQPAGQAAAPRAVPDVAHARQAGAAGRHGGHCLGALLPQRPLRRQPPRERDLRTPAALLLPGGGAAPGHHHLFGQAAPSDLEDLRGGAPGGCVAAGPVAADARGLQGTLCAEGCHQAVRAAARQQRQRQRQQRSGGTAGRAWVGGRSRRERGGGGAIPSGTAGLALTGWGVCTGALGPAQPTCVNVLCVFPACQSPKLVGGRFPPAHASPFCSGPARDCLGSVRARVGGVVQPLLCRMWQDDCAAAGRAWRGPFLLSSVCRCVPHGTTASLLCVFLLSTASLGSAACDSHACVHMDVVCVQPSLWAGTLYERHRLRRDCCSASFRMALCISVSGVGLCAAETCCRWDSCTAFL